MKTYPAYPQPILRQVTTGKNWYLEVSMSGTLRAAGTTIDDPTPDARVKLVDPTGQAAYKLGLDVSTPPLITATALSSPRDASYQDLPVWSPNGREWNLRVTSGGSLTVNALSGDWPMSQQTGMRDSGGGRWQLTVSDGGIMSSSGPSFLPIGDGNSSIKLRADDDSASFEITVDANGVLFVTGPNNVQEAQYYELLLTSPSGLRFPMSVNANGILSIDTAMQELDARDQWPLVLQSRSNILYVVDSRFRAPVPGNRGRGYGRRRG